MSVSDILRRFVFGSEDYKLSYFGANLYLFDRPYVRCFAESEFLRMMGATTLGSPGANQGLNGTKKTITDFFGKSPQKGLPVENKRKDLLDYFSKPSCGMDNNNGSLVEEFSQSANSPKRVVPVNNPANSVDSKNKKRKYSRKDLTVSNNDLCEGDGAQSKKRKKKTKSNDLIEKASVKQKYPSSGSIIMETVTPSSQNSEEKVDVKETSVKKAPGKSAHRSLAKPKCPNEKIKIYEWSKPFGTSDGNNLNINLPSDLSNDANSSKNALELSYEEFLLSQEMDTEPEKLENEPEQKEDKLEKLEDDISTSPCPKATKPVSIVAFFSPIQKLTPRKGTSDSQKVTVFVDIHPEPRQKPPSQEKKHTGSKSGKVVRKTISFDAKSKVKEQNSIVVLSSEDSSEVIEVLPLDATKQKSSKKANSNAECGPKNSSNKKDSSSAFDVKSGKSSSQCLLNFTGHKTSLTSKSQEISVLENTNCSQLTLAFPNQKEKSPIDVALKNPEDEPFFQETTSTKLILKRKRGRARKNPVKTSEDIEMVNKEQKTVKNPEHKIGMKNSQTTDTEAMIIQDTNEEPIPEENEENNSKNICSDGQEKTDGSSAEFNLLSTSEKKTLDDDSLLKSKENTSKTEESAPTTLGTRRSARLRDHKIPSPLRYIEEVDTLTVTPKIRKAKNKSTPSPPEKSKENSTGKESQTKQADTGKLAPIFLKKKEKEKAVIVVDEEALKSRRAFLMSGLTDEAKRLQQANALLSPAHAEYPPIPLDNHIQQKPSPKQDSLSLDVWNLSKVSLPGLADFDDSLETFSWETPKWNCPSSLVRICEDKRIKPLADKVFSSHRPLSESGVSDAIKVLSTSNPSFPVQRFYDMATMKNKNCLRTVNENAKSKEKSVEKPKAIEPTPAVEEPKGRAVTRRSLSRRKVSQNVPKPDVPKEDTEKEKADKIETPLEEKGCDILWTEKYQPQHSVEMISNCGNVKKLKSWLLEWKQQTDKEIRKLKKLLKKQSKHKKSKGENSNSASSWLEDDSTFEASSSESDDDSLCNTMLLTGPHGVGKTSTIYALAAELGYQIFEVNASSARSGKKILTKLQEATQSHQVSKDKAERTIPVNVDLTNNFTSQIGETIKNSEKKSAVPSSFANLFKSSKSSQTDPPLNCKESKKPESSKGRKKQTSLTRTKGQNKSGEIVTLKSTATATRKPGIIAASLNGDFESTSDKIKKRVNISSTSLILFDEVDVVLEEDKGFWAAIQSFMQSTKRPIILTASSSDIVEQFGSYFEHLSFRLPSTKVITSHLQTLCLAENVVTDASGISSLVDYFNADMRSCLLSLQFWINSGGDLTKQDILSGGNPDLNKEAAISPVPEETEPVVPSKNETHLSHQHCLESCLGLNPNAVNMFFNDDLIKPSSNISLEDLTPVCHHGYQRHFSLLHHLFNSKLSLPRKAFPPLPNRVKLLQKSRKQLANNNPSNMFEFLTDNKLYESEYSSDEAIFLTLPKSKENDDKMDSNSQPISYSQESEASCSASQPVSIQMDSLPMEENTDPKPISELQPENICQQRKCENTVLSNLAKFYECCSYNDMFLKCCGYIASVGPSSHYSGSSRSTLTSGLWDELPIEESCSQSVHMYENTLDVVVNLELRTYINCQQEISKAAENVVSGQEHSISIAPQPQRVGLASLQSPDRSPPLTQRKAVENVRSNIPLSSGFQHNSLYLDYLPMLRDVCRAEKARRQAKMKRRFFHYFDNIGFPLRESTLNVLTSGFT